MSAPQPQKTGSFALARAFWRAYPRQTLVIVAAFIAAGIMESVGVTTILPLLSVLSPSQAVPGPVDQAVSAVFGFFGVTPAIAPMLCVIVALLCAKAAVSYFAMSKVNYITVTIGKDMRVRLVNALLRAQWAHFPGLAVGKSANAIGTEAARAALGYMSLGRGLADCIQVVIYIVFALFISWPITLAAFAAGAGIAFMLKGLIAMSRRAGTAQTALMASIAARVTDTLSGIKAIKAMGCENFFIKVLEQENEQLAKAQYSEYTASQLLVIAREPILALILAAGLYAAVVHAGVPVAVLLVLAFMFFRVVSKITAMQSNFQRMASMESAYWSLQSAIAQAESAAENFTAGGAGVPERADIRFEDVSFSYGGQVVLEGINAALPARSFSAIIGPSGAGKTTFIDLLTGLQTPASGRITVGGTALSAIDLAAWRRAIGYLPQETLLFHDTVFANIAMGDPAVTREGAVSALRDAGVWDAIESLPGGIDTMVGERGLRFSGGQRQRIAIARALARRPRLLLLDEPTSALDAETEARLLETIRGLARQVTVVAITHNPAVAEYADHVLHIDRGRVVPG